jgi:type IV pilus assembly protein PilF
MMAMFVGGGLQWGARAVGLCALALLAGGGLTGCAAPGAATSAGSEIVTPSDESDVQRRARIRLELAANYFSMGQTDVALDEVKQALAAEPNYADAFNLRGMIYMRLNDMGMAEESFRRAAALRPQDPDVAHNYGWLLCQQRKFAEAEVHFQRALAQPTYLVRSRTLMAQGLCLEGAGKTAEAEEALGKSYELDPGNPVVGYNLALLKYRRADMPRAQFYIRRLNNSELANSQTLWLGIKVEKRLGNTVAMRQLADQLQKRYPDSQELAAFERGAFDD